VGFFRCAVAIFPASPPCFRLFFPWWGSPIRSRPCQRSSLSTRRLGAARMPDEARRKPHRWHKTPARVQCDECVFFFFPKNSAMQEFPTPNTRWNAESRRLEGRNPVRVSKTTKWWIWSNNKPPKAVWQTKREAYSLSFRSSCAILQQTGHWMHVKLPAPVFSFVVASFRLHG